MHAGQIRTTYFEACRTTRATPCCAWRMQPSAPGASGAKTKGPDAPGPLRFLRSSSGHAGDEYLALAAREGVQLVGDPLP